MIYRWDKKKVGTNMAAAWEMHWDARCCISAGAQGSNPELPTSWLISISIYICERSDTVPNFWLICLSLFLFRFNLFHTIRYDSISISILLSFPFSFSSNTIYSGDHLYGHGAQGSNHDNSLWFRTEQEDLEFVNSRSGDVVPVFSVVRSRAWDCAATFIVTTCSSSFHFLMILVIVFLKWCHRRFAFFYGTLHHPSAWDDCSSSIVEWISITIFSFFLFWTQYYAEIIAISFLIIRVYSRLFLGDVTFF